MARVLTGKKHLAVERGIYKAGGIDPRRRSDLGHLPARGARVQRGLGAVPVRVPAAAEPLRAPVCGAADGRDQAWNTAASFVTNTNWQSYSGENALGYIVQMAGLAVQNFALGRSRHRGRHRAGARLRAQPDRSAGQLLGRPDPHLHPDPAADLDRVRDRLRRRRNDPELPRLPHDHARSPAASRRCPAARCASQEVIKELGTNGGGFFNANSAHPFENPTTWTNWLEIFLLLCISFSLPRTFGVMIGDKRQGTRDRRGDGDPGHLSVVG